MRDLGLNLLAGDHRSSLDAVEVTEDSVEGAESIAALAAMEGLTPGRVVEEGVTGRGEEPLADVHSLCARDAEPGARRPTEDSLLNVSESSLERGERRPEEAAGEMEESRQSTTKFRRSRDVTRSSPRASLSQLSGTRRRELG